MARKKKVVEAEPKIGHNGGPISEERKKQLAGYVSEIERWETEKAVIAADIGEIYNSAKDAGFDVKAMRAVIKDRKKSRDEREAFEAVCDAYKHSLGMLSDTPLGQSAIERAVSSPKVREAFNKLGTPVELTDEEKAKGYSAAFIGKDGTRMSIGTGQQVDLEEAIAAKP